MHGIMQKKPGLSLCMPVAVLFQKKQTGQKANRDRTGSEPSQAL